MPLARAISPKAFAIKAASPLPPQGKLQDNQPFLKACEDVQQHRIG